MILHLCRLEHTSDHVRGVLHIPGTRPLVTVERPWLPQTQWGLPGRSCVPNGTYDLELLHSPSQAGMRWYLVGDGVFARSRYTTDPNHRWGIMFHAANLASQVQGCIAPGLRWADINGEPGVANSADAMDILSDALSYGAPHQLVIQ